MEVREKVIQARILKRLRALGGLWFNIHGGYYQASSIPDIIGVYKGRFVAIEVKRPGKYGNPKQFLTSAQRNTYEQLLANGALALVVDNEEHVMQALAEYDQRMAPSASA